MQKVMVNSATQFSESCEGEFNKPGGHESRVSVTQEGPGSLLGLDELLTTKLDDLRAQSGNQAITAAVLDRDNISDTLTGFTLMARFHRFGIWSKSVKPTNA